METKKDKYPQIIFKKNIEELTLEPGETITVWLNTSLLNRKAVQVELKAYEGIAEIYTSIGNVTIKDFSDYPHKKS